MLVDSSQRIGRYAIYDEIAAGGMATVHLARQRGEAGFERTVAVKRLHPALAKDPDVAEAFANEARHVSRVQHANVVPVLDVVREAGELVLVMELVVGAPLSTLTKQARLQGRRTPANVAVAIVAGALRGLHAAHGAEDERSRPLLLVHRDVSPQNILVGVDGVARVLDFGIAKAMGQNPTTRGQLKGKPSYMSPEQLHGEAVDARTDVYAAAVVLWEVLTGQRLFAGDNDLAVSRKILSKNVDAPTRLEPTLPKALDALTLRGLARDPDERFATALEFAEALEQEVTPASASEVGAYLRELCAEDVLAIDEAKRRIEADESAAASEPPASRTGVSRFWYVALAGVVVVGGVLIGLRRTSSDAPTPTSAAAVPESHPSTAPIAQSAALPAAPGAASQTEAAPTASAPKPEASVLPRPAARPLRPPTPTAPAKKAKDCDPPYVVDQDGFHRMKPHCL